MVRCVCCNANLSDFEATRKDATTRRYLDLCNRCYREVGSPFALVRNDLAHTIDNDLEDDPMYPLAIAEEGLGLDYLKPTRASKDYENFSSKDLDKLFD